MKLWHFRNNATPSGTSLSTRLNLEAMETRTVPAASTGLALVDNSNSVPGVVLINPTDTQLLPEITPFDGFTGTITASTGDVNGDGVPDIIVAAEVPGIHVKVFDGSNGNLLQSFYAFPGFNGTVSLGSADVNGDGFADVLVGANGANGAIKAFSGQDGSLLSSFLAFPGYQGPVSVAGADFNNSGFDQIVVGAGAPGVDGRIAIFNPDGSLSNGGFFAFPGFGGPINVATGDLNGDGVPDIVVGVGPGGAGGQVNVYSGADFSLLSSFLALAPLDASDTEGVLVSTGDAGTGQTDILALPEGSPFSGPFGYDLNGNLVFDPNSSSSSSSC